MLFENRIDPDKKNQLCRDLRRVLIGARKEKKKVTSILNLSRMMYGP